MGDFVESINVALSSGPFLLGQADLAHQDHAGDLSEGIVKRVGCISQHPFSLIGLPMREHGEVVLMTVDRSHVYARRLASLIQPAFEYGDRWSRGGGQNPPTLFHAVVGEPEGVVPACPPRQGLKVSGVPDKLREAKAMTYCFQPLSEPRLTPENAAVGVRGKAERVEPLNGTWRYPACHPMAARYFMRIVINDKRRWSGLSVYLGVREAVGGKDPLKVRDVFCGPGLKLCGCRLA